MPAELFSQIEDEFYASGQKVWKQWKQKGIDPAQLFDAVLNDSKLARDLIRKAGNDESARLLREVAVEIQEADMERIVHHFLDAAWQEVETNHLQINRREGALSLEFEGQLQRMKNRILSALLKNPSRFPSRPSRNDPPPDLDAQLREPLI